MTPEHETEMFEALARDLAAMPARIKRARETAQAAVDAGNRQLGDNAAREAAHRLEIDALTEKHKAKCAERERGLAARETALVERERVAEEKFRRGEAALHAAESKAADLRNRYQGAA
jgi:hypothetical protein